LAGCINTLNLLVLDATPEEIDAAAKGGAAGGAQADNGAASGANNGGAAQQAAVVDNNACPAVANDQAVQAAAEPAAAEPAAAEPAAAEPAAAAPAAAGALDLGTCTDATIKFALGLDGRTGTSFAPNNKADFSQGSANNIKIITNFICSQLASQCKAGQATIDACNAGATAAGALGANGGAAGTSLSVLPSAC
jgi:hypothetical protein